MSVFDPNNPTGAMSPNSGISVSGVPSPAPAIPAFGGNSTNGGAGILAGSSPLKGVQGIQTGRVPTGVSGVSTAEYNFPAPTVPAPKPAVITPDKSGVPNNNPVYNNTNVPIAAPIASTPIATATPTIVKNADGTTTVTNSNGTVSTIPADPAQPAANNDVTANTNAPASSEPTIGSAFNPSVYAPNIATATPSWLDPAQPVDEDKVRADTLSTFQNQIDSVKQLYGSQIAQARINGLNELGDTSVSAARSGALGGVSGADAYGAVNANTLNTTSALGGAEGNALGDILSKSQALAETTISRQQQAKLTGGSTYLQNIQTREGVRKQNLSDLGTQIATAGIDPTTISSSDLATLAANYNSNPTEVMANIKAAELALRQSIAQKAKDALTIAPAGSQVLGSDGTVVGSGGPTAELQTALGKLAETNAPTWLIAKHANDTTTSQLYSDPDVSQYLGTSVQQDPLTGQPAAFNIKTGFGSSDALGGAGLGTSDGTSIAATIPVSAAAGNQYFTQNPQFQALPPGAQAIVANLLNYQSDPTTGIDRTAYTLYKGLIDQIDPTFDASKYGRIQQLKTAYSTGSESDQITAANTVVGHINDLTKDFQALNNGGFKPFNAVSNAAKSIVGSPALDNVNRDISAVQSELAKIYAGSGGGSESEWAQWGKGLSTNITPDEQASLVKNALGLVFSKTNSLSEKYKQQTGESYQIWNPEAQSILSSFGLSPQEYGTAQPKPQIAETQPTNGLYNF